MPPKQLYGERTPITMRLDPKLHKKVTTEAAKRGVSVNFLVSYAIGEWLDNHEKDWK